MKIFYNKNKTIIRNILIGGIIFFVWLRHDEGLRDFLAGVGIGMLILNIVEVFVARKKKIYDGGEHLESYEANNREV